jgi:hypothetical protein
MNMPSYSEPHVPTKLCDYLPQSDQLVKFTYDPDQPISFCWYEEYMYMDVRLGCDICCNGLAHGMGMGINIRTIMDADGFFQLNDLDFDLSLIPYERSYPEYYTTTDPSMIAKLSHMKQLYSDQLETTYQKNDEDCQFQTSTWGLTSHLEDVEKMGGSGSSLLPPNKVKACRLCIRCYRWFMITLGHPVLEPHSLFANSHPFQLIWMDWLHKWQSKLQTQQGDRPSFNFKPKLIPDSP